MLPSPEGYRLGLRCILLSRLLSRSLTLRPRNSLTTLPSVALSMGFRSFGFPPDCHPSYGASGFYPGGTTSR